MNRDTNGDLNRRLMRLLHGESPPDEAASTRQLLDGDPRAAARYREVERLWNELEPVPTKPADGSLLAGIRARLDRRESEPPIALWGLAPAWGRAVAAAVLASGIGLGAWLGAGVAAADEASFDLEPSLSESYWSAIESDTIESETMEGYAVEDENGEGEQREER